MASDHESHGEGNHADHAAPAADVAEASAAVSGEASGSASEAPVKKAARRRATRPAKSTAPGAGPSSTGPSSTGPSSTGPSSSTRSAAADTAPSDVASALAQIELPPAPGDAPATTGAEAAAGGENGAEAAPAKRRPARKRTAPRAAPRAEATGVIEGTDPAVAQPIAEAEAPSDTLADTPSDTPADTPVKPARRSRRKAVAPAQAPASTTPTLPEPAVSAGPGPASADPASAAELSPAEPDEEPAEPAVSAVPVLQPLFQAPEPVRRPRRSASRPAGPPTPVAGEVDRTLPAAVPAVVPAAVPTDELLDERAEDTDLIASPDSDDAGLDPIDEEISDEDSDDEASEEAADGGDQPRRRRRRGGRGRRGRTRAEGDEPEVGEATGTEALEAVDAVEIAEGEEPAGDDEAEESEDAAEGGGTSRRRRRRRRRGTAPGDADSTEDPPNTVTRVRESRTRESRESRDSREDTATGIKGSTRLEAKKQRRREGREQGRRRQVISEAEFLARRESVERVMVVRENDGRTQIGVLEDGVLVEHYVARKTQSSMVGNVYLGRVQNVLPSMEAAFIDIGKGRNAVLYAGEVNWDQAGLDGQPRRIENALKAGEPVLVQVTKDPIGHKGARLTSQISMPGRYLVYVPEGSMTGISRKLPENERARLKKVLKAVVPEHAGVIVRTAAEGASDGELERDVARLQAQWEDIDKKVAGGNAPSMLYSEPDLAIRVVRDIFNEDFSSLVISGDDAWDTLQGYIGHVAPDLAARVTRWDGQGDVFAAKRIDEQLHKAMERKVWLPSGGSLVIDRTEAMTVVDVNTGKFTGSGGSNLEETVTKNNLEAAEEVVRQLRLRDIGGIIVVDFIDMVLESNRDLVMRRLLECLGRDRTRHQVAEVTSLGLVQMTRKRVGQGLVEVFSENCEHCGGRGIIVHDEPVEKKQDTGGGSGRRGRN